MARLVVLPPPPPPPLLLLLLLLALLPVGAQGVCSSVAGLCVGTNAPCATGACYTLDCTDTPLGALPCDVPANTTTLVLTNTSLVGAFSFDLLLAAIPQAFCPAQSTACTPTLQSLVLRRNNYTAFASPPPGFWLNYSVAASIDLSDNALATAQAGAFNGAVFMGDLQLAGNQFAALPSYTFNATSINGNLNLSHNVLGNINVYSVFGCTIGRSLVLANNRITVVEVNAFQGTSVGNSFDLQNNAISTLLSGAFYFISVGNSILMNGNIISVISSNAFLNTAALTVNLAGMPIRAIKPYAFNRANIGNLTLTGLQLTQLDPYSFSSLTCNNFKLSSQFPLRSIQDNAFEGSTFNSTLDLRGQGIQVLNASAFTFISVNGDLLLSENEITTIGPSAFSSASVSGNVDISFNQISSLSAQCFTQLNCANVLLNNNFISAIGQDAFFGASLGGYLSLATNQLATLGANSFNTASINGSLILANNPLRSVSTNAFYLSEILGSVNMSGFGLATLAPGAFAKATISGALDLSHNIISVIPASAFSLANINALDLSFNVITEIDVGAFALATVPGLQLSHNLISSLNSTTFASLGDESSVNISHNRIAVLRPNWFQPFPLKNPDFALDLSSNPTTCVIATLGEFYTNLQCTCFAGLLGNGQFCTSDKCLYPSVFTGAAPPPHGRWLCTGNISSGGVCPLGCDEGYEVSGPALTCLGGVWGQLPNNAGRLPTCVRKAGITTKLLAVIITGALVGWTGIMFLIQLCYRKYAKMSVELSRTTNDLQLTEQLLKETKQGVIDLFTIAWRDIMLVQRIDAGSEGSFGEVYSGIWNGTVPVAVKRLRSNLIEFDKAALGEFESEVNVMRSMRHSNIVLFYGAGNDNDNVPFLVTELMDGGSLHTLLAREPQIPWPVKLQYTYDCVKGMNYLHSKNMIHRDLKSLNLLLSSNRVVKVADFGTSKLVKTLTGEFDVPFDHAQAPSSPDTDSFSGGTGSHSHRSESNFHAAASSPGSLGVQSLLMTRAVGTLLWMAPEVVAGRKYGLPADVFSFSMVCVEIATHQPPWTEMFAGKLFLTSLLLETVESGVRPRVPADCPLASIIAECWDSSPAARPTFAALLKRFPARWPYLT